MNSTILYNTTCDEVSRLTTQRFSTSFTLGIKAFEKPLRKHIYSIYAFSRYTDEIVDTFLDHSVEQRQVLLDAYQTATWQALEIGASPYPVLHSFQRTVREFDIPKSLIEAFFRSMTMDLESNSHTDFTYGSYIYGSAEVIGLMCLMVFVGGNKSAYAKLEGPARRLGAAFQKVNFLRDMKSDFEERGRVYFPGISFRHFDHSAKETIQEDIEEDFREALKGIMALPRSSRKGVYLAYKYYYSLFKKIKRAKPEAIQEERLRIADPVKMYILFKSLVRVYANAY